MSEISSLFDDQLMESHSEVMTLQISAGILSNPAALWLDKAAVAVTSIWLDTRALPETHPHPQVCCNFSECSFQWSILSSFHGSVPSFPLVGPSPWVLGLQTTSVALKSPQVLCVSARSRISFASSDYHSSWFSCLSLDICLGAWWACLLATLAMSSCQAQKAFPFLSMRALRMRSFSSNCSWCFLHL